MMEVTTVGLENNFLYHVQDMQNQYVEYDATLLDHAGNKKCRSVKASLLVRELIANEVDERTLTKFKTDKEKTDHLDSLECWQKEENLTQKKNTRILFVRSQEEFIRCVWIAIFTMLCQLTKLVGS